MENLFGKLLGFDGSASPMGVVCTNKKVQQSCQPYNCPPASSTGNIFYVWVDAYDGSYCNSTMTQTCCYY